MPGLEGAAITQLQATFAIWECELSVRGLAYLKIGRNLNLYVNSTFQFLPNV